MKPFLFTVAILGLTAASLRAQAIVLKDGMRINASDFTVADGKINRKMKLAGGQEGTSTVSFDSIDRIDWPEVREVLEAQTLLSEGKTKEATDALQSAKDYFKPFKSIKGSPYAEICFAQVEALDQVGDFDSLLRILPEVEGMKWGDDRKLRLKIIKLNMDRRTAPDQDAILSQAETLLSDTDDAATCARLWLTIAEIHVRKERWEQALMAYLQVPVFYGSQGTLVPQAEIAAARMLAKMERFKDAVAFYQRIVDQYAGSEIAATAKKEMLPINGLDNKPDTPAPATAAK
ncbi:MAG: tetratricopeptide repeat protein [Roseimicrobium sp.]